MPELFPELPWIVLAFVSTPVPVMRAKFCRVTAPDPVSVAFPLRVRSVKLTLDSSRMLPELVIVPAMFVMELLLPMNLPVLLTPVRVAAWLAAVRMTPVPAVLRMPPVIEAPAENCTSDPFSALIVPPVLLNPPPPEPLSTRMPVLLARSVPWFTSPLARFGLTYRLSPATFASINPPL